MRIQCPAIYEQTNTLILTHAYAHARTHREKEREKDTHTVVARGKRLTQSLTINKLKRLGVAVCAHFADSTVILLMMVHEHHIHVSLSFCVCVYVDAILCAFNMCSRW